MIRGAERLSIQEIAAARVELKTAREEELQQADPRAVSSTISNLGMFGVEQFVAVLNPPQVAILAVGAIEEKPVVRDGEITARLLMSLTPTCDHRAVDGADAADFLRHRPLDARRTRAGAQCASPGDAALLARVASTKPEACLRRAKAGQP